MSEKERAMSDAREALVDLIDGAIPDDLPGYRQRYTDRAADAILAAGRTPPNERVAEAIRSAAHPEDVCHRCGGPNVAVWHAPSSVWNEVEQHEGILCPQCFTEAYTALHPGTAWHIGPEVSGPCRYPLLTNEGRTEAEVKAEALREAAVDVIQDDQGTDEWYAGWLRDRANYIEKGADRG